MESKPISVELLRATRGDTLARNGLITLRVQIPVYVWTELLTHRRFARNASSSRAQNTKRHIAMGYYAPVAFFGDKPGMRVGDALDDAAQQEADNLWHEAWATAVSYVERLTALGVSREQANRLLPTIKMVNGIVTGTEHAWEHFLALRANPSADLAMQAFAYTVWDVIRSPQWVYSREHLPFGDDPVTAVAAAARVSYSGKSVTDDKTLHDRLLKEGHLSPFEHAARYVPESYAAPSAMFSRPEDVSNSGHAWYTYRSMLENGEDW